MIRNYLFIVTTILPGSSMMHQTETYEETQVHQTKDETLNEFCQKLPLYLKKYKDAEDFEKEIQKAIDTLQVQNYVFINLFQGYQRTYITIVPPKFD